MSPAMVFHHRQPTATKNVQSSCHPFKVQVGGHILYVIHNGYLQNDQELYDSHRERGIRYVSDEDGTGKEFNDSEALAWDIALAMYGGQEKMEARGMIAFIAMEADSENRMQFIHYAHNFSAPLKISDDGNTMLMGSEVPGETVPEHTLHTYSFFLDTTVARPFEVPGYAYKSFHPKEEEEGSEAPKIVHVRRNSEPRDMELAANVALRITKEGIRYQVRKMALTTTMAEAEGRSDYLARLIFSATPSDLMDWIDMAEDEILSLESNSGKDGEDETLLSAWWSFYNMVDMEIEARVSLSEGGVLLLQDGDPIG